MGCKRSQAGTKVLGLRKLEDRVGVTWDEGVLVEQVFGKKIWNSVSDISEMCSGYSAKLLYIHIYMKL